MNCDHCLTQIPELLANTIPSEPREHLLAHFMTCPRCGPEFESTARVWQDLDQLPFVEPSEVVGKRFYAMLDGFVQGTDAAQPPPPTSIRRPIASRIWLQALAAAALLATGFFLGRPNQATVLIQPQPPMQSTAFSWFNAPSAMTRLQGISNLAANETQPDLLALLFIILKTDPCIDVRLAAIRALQPFKSLPQIRRRFAGALLLQDAPLVQIEILDLLSDSHPNNTTATLEALLQREPLNPHVKQRAQELLLEIR